MGIQIKYNGDPILRLFWKAKDGGPDSNVTGYWLIECKALCSIALLKFSEGSREAYHSHAFNAWSWILWGGLREFWREHFNDFGGVTLTFNRMMLPSFKPIYTPRDRLHQVHGVAKTTWALTFRGPWKDTWNEFFEKTGKWVRLTHGRKVVKESHEH